VRGGGGERGYEEGGESWGGRECVGGRVGLRGGGGGGGEG